MKKSLFILSLLLTMIVATCKAAEPISANVNYISSADGSITMRCVGYGKNKKEAIISAEKGALNALLFRGLPGSPESSPMVSTNETEAKKQFSTYFDEMFTKDRYKSFIMSTVNVSDLAKDASGKKSMGFEVKVNTKALRSDLEQQGIIRKFGL